MQKMVKDIHMSGKELTEMVQLRRQDIGDYCVIPGPRERLSGFLRQIEKPIKNFSFMEYEMYTGTIEGIRITSINGGRYAADTAITTELLCAINAPVMIRLGSCGALRSDIKIGDLIVVESAVRGEGVTPYYVEDKNYQPKPDKEWTDGLEQSAKQAGMNVHKGKVFSTDAILQLTRKRVESLVDQGCIATDMVASTFLTICQLNNIPAAVILAVSDNVINGQLGFLDTNYYMSEYMMIQITLDMIKKREKEKQAV